jgi:hypothetical protein
MVDFKKGELVFEAKAGKKQDSFQPGSVLSN